MSALSITLVVIAAVIVVILAAWVMALRRRSRLRGRFGSEYDRALGAAGSRRAGERALRERVQERRTIDLRPLASSRRDQYAQQWREVQAQFVDAPQTALRQADALVTSVMRDIGYPVDDFEHQAALTSVDHPSVVDNYREGHEAFVSSVNGRGTTETMRRGFVCYRTLFTELLDDQAATSEVGE